MNNQAGGRLGFSYDKLKLFGKFGFLEFRSISEKLEKIVNESRSHVESFVVTYGDKNTNDRPVVSFELDEINKALEQGEIYSLKEFNKEVWERALRSQLTMTISDRDFVVRFTHDKAEENRLFFYGHGLDERTHSAMMRRFYKRGLLYTLGIGLKKPPEIMGKIIETRPPSKLSV